MPMPAMLPLLVILALAAVPCRAADEPLFRFAAPFASVEGSWAGKAAVVEGRAVLTGGPAPGAAGYAVQSDIVALGDRSPALQVQVGPANAVKRLLLRLTDQDGHVCTWGFNLPAPGRMEVVTASDGASLALPNRPDVRDGGVNDLRRITAWQLATGSDERGVLDLQVAAVLAVVPDAAALATRAALAEKRTKEQGWLAAREKVTKMFVANFPELSAATPPAIPGKRTIRAFHVGNSLTFQALSCNFTVWSPLAYEERIIAFMAGRGVHYVPAWHVSWGASLPSIWNHPFEPAVANSGPLGRALADYTFDVLTLQLWGSDLAGDLDAGKGLIAMAKARNPAVRTFLVETWVHKEKTLTPDFPTQWARPWTAEQRGGTPPIPCRAYARLVFQRMQEANPGLHLIPVGSVLAELDKRLRAGALPGLTRVEDLYADEVHLNAIGNYAALETYYTVIVGESPVGRPRTDRFPAVSDACAALIQEVVWQVVSTTPESGVSAPAR